MTSTAPAALSAAPSPARTFRNRRGELVDMQSVPATRLKNELAGILEQAARDGAVTITRHDAPRAVILSIEEFESLVGARTQGLEDLGAQFDSLLAGMQAPASRKGMQAAFEAAPGALGRAAVKAARKRV
jgi:prevent-host-death family protein